MRNALICAGLLVAVVGCGSSSGGGTGGTRGAAGANGAGGTSSGTGAAGSGGAAALVAGTYAGTAPSTVCYGFMSGTGCTVQITINGIGPTYQVTEFIFPGGAYGSGGSVDQAGSSVLITLLTDGTSNFCPNSDYTASGTVGAGGTSMSVMLTGPPCGSSDSVYVMVTLTKQ